MKMKKKIIATLLAALTVASSISMTSCGSTDNSGSGDNGGSADKKYVVGICQLAVHQALDAATAGFKEALTEKLGDKVEFKEQNAAYSEIFVVAVGEVIAYIAKSRRR